jgi:hypothetical protein
MREPRMTSLQWNLATIRWLDRGYFGYARFQGESKRMRT